MAMKRKAYSGYSGNLRFKRRRTGLYRSRFRRRRYGGSRRTSSWTIQTSRGQGIRPTSRKIRPKAWRRMLWRDTIANIHWKSALNFASTSTTGIVVGTSTPVVIRPTFGDDTPAAADAFWTAAGGAVVKDTGSVLPHFEEGSIIIRGGQVGITFNVPDTVTQEIVVRLWCVWLNKEPVDTVVTGSTIPYGAQLTTRPDLESRFGKVLDYKEAYINGGHPVFSYVRRMKVQKIDTYTHAIDFGSQLAFVFEVINMTDTTNVTVNHIFWHDLSFAADADN